MSREVINRHGMAMTGMVTASRLTDKLLQCDEGAYVQIDYDLHTGKIHSKLHEQLTANSWYNYESDTIITVINTYFPMEAQDIVDCIVEAVQSWNDSI